MNIQNSSNALTKCLDIIIIEEGNLPTLLRGSYDIHRKHLASIRDKNGFELNKPILIQSSRCPR